LKYMFNKHDRQNEHTLHQNLPTLGSYRTWFTHHASPPNQSSSLHCDSSLSSGMG